MSKFSGYIVEDESLARYALKKKLVDFPEIDILGEAGTIAKALEEIPIFNPDILFLDIQLNEGTGFDLLNALNFKGKIIFITAFDTYAIRAFEINAIDYLLKPIITKRLKKAIQRIMHPENDVEQEDLAKLNYDDRFMLSAYGYINFIKISEVAVIKSSGDYTEIILTDGKTYLETKSMNQWEQVLPDNQFCRVSRFHIINFDYVSKIEKSTTMPALLYIDGIDEPIKISKSYYHRIKRKYK